MALLSLAVQLRGILCLSSVVAALLVTACGGEPARTHGAGHHRFEAPEEWAKRFDDPARDEWQRPDVVIAHLKLSSDSKVADIGAGTGYFAVRISPLVPVGKVFAVDIEPSMVEYTRERVKKAGLINVSAVLGTTDDPKLPEPVDVALLVDTYHHIEGREAYFMKLRGSLAPGARLVIVDYKVDEAISGPPMAMRLSAPEVIDELEAAGYRLTARSEGALPRQYILLFEALAASK